MQEEFLHYIWKSGRYDAASLRSTDGEDLRILDAGKHNHDSGPDFCEAKICINGTTWVGQVEIHLKASDWLRHSHQDDPAYNNVILHVVLEADVAIHLADGSRLPCLELRKRIAPRMLGRYRLLRKQEGWIPCHSQWPQPEPVKLAAWLDRLLVERLEEKVERLKGCLEKNRGDWEQTFYGQLARGFGFHVNADPFEQLADRVPLRLLIKHGNSLIQMESLLFGQAGLLEGAFHDTYPLKLQREYKHLRNKYKLHPLLPVAWKFMRMRPNNFPTLRIAQFATLHFQGHALFSKMLAAANSKEIEHMFELRLSNYWKNHFLFDKASPASGKKLGRNAIRLLTINTVAPMLFLYGMEHGNASMKEQAIDLLEALPPEKNRIIRQWTELGLCFDTSGQSQAALQWKKEYCDKRRCLDCAVGRMILD